MANKIVEQINAELENLQKELKQFKSNVEYLNGAKTHVDEAVRSVNQAEGHLNDKVEDLKNTYNSFLRLNESISGIISKIESINFPERLDGIEKNVQRTIIDLNATKKSTIEELQKASEIITKADFEGKFKKLENVINSSIAKSSEIITQSQKQHKESIEKIEKEFLGTKYHFDKLGTGISNVHAINQAISERLNVIEVSLIQNITQKIVEDANSRFEKLHISLDTLDKNVSIQMKDLISSQIESQKAILTNIESSAIKQRIYTYVTWGLFVVGIIVTILILN